MILEAVDVASGINWHLDITFGLQLISVLFREVFDYPCISIFHLLVNVFSVIRTLYVELARTAPPTNTNFRLTFLLTRLQEALYEDLAV